MTMTSIWGVDYNEGFDRFTVPISLQCSLVLWIEEGIYPSGMLAHILVNDLVGLMLMADRSEQSAARSVVRFLAKCAPIYAWGDRIAVELWPAKVAHKRGSLATP